MKFGRAPTTKQTRADTRGAYPPPLDSHGAGIHGESALSERPSVDRAITWSLVAVFAAIAVWNAFGYPPVGGFDAAEHIAYARGLADGELPSGGADYTPPVFYVLAAGALELGDVLGLDEPERVVQLMNAALGVGTALLLLALTGLLFPGRPVVRWTALAFFVCCPIVLRTVAMFHPQPLALFLSTLALVLTARMVVRRRYGLWEWLSLAATLGALQLVRSVGLWTVGVVLLTLVAAALADPSRRRAVGKGLAIGASAALLLALPWYVHLQRETGNAVFGRSSSALPLSQRWPGAFYVSPELPTVVTKPHRGALPPRFLPILYTDTWGDYFGIWSWSPPRPELTPSVNRRLVVQSIVGLPLTAFALAGWFALLGLAVARWRDAPARLVVVLMPLVSVAGALYYAVQQPSTDGDTVKGMFLLTAAPAWAICVRLRRGHAARAESAGRDSGPGGARRLRARLPALCDLRVGVVSEWAFLRGGLLAVAALCVAALVEWGVYSVVHEGPDPAASITTCSGGREGLPSRRRAIRSLKSAELGALRTTVETNGVTIAVAKDREGAESIVAAYRSVAGDLEEGRLERRGRLVYLWDRPASPTQRQALFNCEY